MSDLTAAGGSVKSSVLEREMCALASEHDVVRDSKTRNSRSIGALCNMDPK